MSSALKTATDIPRGKLESAHSTAGQLDCTVVPTLTAEQEAKLWRKIDLRVIPITCLMFFFTFADRAAVGFAAINGLLTQLDLTGNKFNMILVSPTSDDVMWVADSVGIPLNSFMNLSFSHSVCSRSQQSEPSSLFYTLRRVPTHETRWLPGMLIVWGFLITFTGFVKTYHQLLAMRVCLGAVEAGLYPGISYYLTLWYPKFKLQYRFAMFAGTTSLAGSALSGFLGFAVGGLNGVGGLETWSWIFILDGIGTMLAGIAAVFLMADHPSTVKFLTDGERLHVMEQIGSGAAPENNEHGAVQQIWATLTDWQVWALSVVMFSMVAPSFALTYFLPTIVHDFGYSTAVTQLLTMPLSVLSIAFLLVVAYYSDTIHLRSPFIFAGQFITLVGFIINITNAPSGVKYFGLALCLAGNTSGTVGVVSWLANNLGGSYKRATALAVQITIGHVGGAIASIIFRSQDAPRYTYGIRLEIIFLSVGLSIIPMTVLAYKRINAARDREELLQQQQGEKALHEDGGGGKRIGDRALSFRYTL
ncbi:MFS general substrate transporter [Melanogaster broomeanus]|nr:MFS general substrate transporter [Melanogaster broomeanus]